MVKPPFTVLAFPPQKTIGSLSRFPMAMKVLTSITRNLASDNSISPHRSPEKFVPL